MTPEPLNAADCRLLLSLVSYAIVSPDQRARVEAWLTHERETQELVEDVARPLCDAGPAPEKAWGAGEYHLPDVSPQQAAAELLRRRGRA